MDTKGTPFGGVGSAPQVEERVIHLFPIHEELTGLAAGQPKEVGIIELTPDEELRATRRAGGDQLALAMELAKGAFVEVDGQPISLGNGTADVAWKKLTPAIRQAIVTFYAEVNTPQEKHLAFSKANRKRKVGRAG